MARNGSAVSSFIQSEGFAIILRKEGEEGATALSALAEGRANHGW
jgi:hypothetical protein